MINDIRLQHFRSYDDSSFELSPAVNIIVGPNASGKTNLLEAILVLMRGGSYRAKDAELVRHGSDWARLDARLKDNQFRTVKLKTTPEFTKTYEIDEKTYSRLPMSKSLGVVLFEPNNLLLFSGAPDMRRSFLDDLLEQTEAGYGAQLRHYKRVLAQRNALLKHQPKDLQQQLFVWNVRLSELGGYVARKHAALIDVFNQHATELYSRLADKSYTVRLQYDSRFLPQHYETELLRALEKNLELEKIRGFTLYGPHRDDFAVNIDEHMVQATASRGETRTLLLTLKMLELQLVEQARDQKPILLLDDVFSELDGRRRQALTRFVESHQTFITTTDADIVIQHFSADHTIIPMD